MNLTHFAKVTARVAAGLALLALSLIKGAAQDRENGTLHIVKDCATFSGIPGSTYCTIVTSNLAELPAGSRIYYDELTGGPAVGAGYLDSNVFVYVKPGQWAVGRCTVPNDNTKGLLHVMGWIWRAGRVHRTDNSNIQTGR